MANETLAERRGELLKEARAEVAEKSLELKSFKKLVKQVIDDKFHPLTLTADDVLGGLAGIGLWRGGNAILKLIPFSKGWGWGRDIAHGAIGLLGYGGNVLLPFDKPMSMGREVARRAFATQITFAADEAFGRIWAWATTPKAPPPPPAPAPPTPPAKK